MGQPASRRGPGVESIIATAAAYLRPLDCPRRQTLTCPVFLDIEHLPSMPTRTQETADSVFRWAGSKKPILPRLLERSPASYSTYFEPFVGSGALLFGLAPKRSVVNDSNVELINAYRQIARQPARLANSVRTIGADNSAYLAMRSMAPDTLTPYRRAVRFVYLNRHCFNGVYRLNQRGMFNVPQGTRTGPIPSNDEFRRAAQVLRSARLTCTDFEESISAAGNDDYVYLDPPYSTSERFRGEYGSRRFDEADLDRLISTVIALDQRNGLFLISYLDHRKLRRALRRFRIDTVRNPRRVASKVASRTAATELLISNY
jgi:DNA adenine methylase